LDIDGVADGSTTDTFAAARLWIDTDRWQGVPFLLRTGKRLAASEQRVSLVMRPVDGPLTGVPDQGNVLTFSLAGSGELVTSLVLKRPGADFDLVQGELSLALDSVAGGDPLPPYVALLNDVLTGDRSLFTSSAGLEQAWRVADPLLRNRPQVHPYEPGSWGPEAASELAAPGAWLLGEA
jgi:glucose-6-phosphate 1-dehydrogenase